jgi:2-dehydro-3-deoxyphosphogluconate aldolase/(4S)-4-hydroxy-2-oxoglutarate aldolase
MTNTQVVAKIREVGLVPILRTPSADDALEMAEALVAAQLSNLEIPLTVPGGIEVIGELAAKFGDHVLIGAGTVLDRKAAESCVRAGARFIISPSIDLDTIAFCKEAGVAIFPGALTPTEIVTAWRAGADMVKVFPCSAMGGASYIKAVKAPLPDIELMPTGGVSVETAGAFIEAGAAALGVGSDLVDLKALREGRGDVIAARAKVYLELVREARAG